MASSSEFGKWLSTPPPGEEVVISGISGRFPESNNMTEFQENLFNKVDMVTDDDRRWKLNHPEIPQRSAKIYNIDKIDAGYFGLHYRQADIMDPMIRKFLECAIEAIMDAGVNPSELQGTKTAVCIGAAFSEAEFKILSNITKPESFGITGYLRSFIAHRVSYFLKLKGISCILDTACSSSLNAMENAFKLIRTGKCENALVGGTYVLRHPGVTRSFFRLGVLSSDGACKVFDQAANGYVRGETGACVFLQKAKNSKRIYAQVLYSKINGDGFKSAGITFPSTQTQSRLITEVLQESGVDPSEISYVEAHGTGTEVGDPAEVEAIDDAIAKKRTKPLLIGSVKCSVGHAEPASGLLSVAKILIAMETGYIAPNIHLKKVKEGLIGFKEGRLIPVVELTKLDRDDAIVGLNNFGFGGNNCNLLSQRFKKTKINQGLPKDDIARLVCVSGRTKKAVSLLLDNINKKPLDAEYIGLLHQLFKKNIAGHCYRGFTIVTKSGPITTNVTYSTKKKQLYLIFGKFENQYKPLNQYLMKFECFKSTITRINNIIEANKNKIENPLVTLESFSTQIGILELLKLLEIEIAAVYDNSSERLISRYYYKEIALEDAVNTIIITNKQILENKNEAITVQSRKTRTKPIQNILNGVQNSDITDHSLSDSHIYNNMKKTSKKLVVLDISDTPIDNDGHLTFAKNNDILFLEILGRLYTEGHDLQIHKLYPEVKFPVSRNTPMIAPSIQWNYDKSWYTFKFGVASETDITQQAFNISITEYEDQKCLAGHVIDGRVLVPATEYLQLVQTTYVKRFRMAEIDDLPFVFENCRFIKAVTLPKTGKLHLLVSIQKSSGNFEIVEKNSLIVSGRVHISRNIEKYQTNLPPCGINEDRKEYLDQDEIYRELHLRGYNYSGLFRGIAKCNVDGSAALIKWENNWTTFLDKMLQLKILQMDTRSLYVPVGIRKIAIDPVKHAKFIEKQTDSLCPVYNYKENNVLISGGVEISGIQATAILKKKSRTDPVLEKYVFVPNDTQTILEESIRVVTQIILENTLDTKFKAVEILDEYTEQNSQPLSHLFCKALDDLPSVIVNLTISSKKELEIAPPIKVEKVTLTPESNLLLIVASSIFERASLLNQVLNALSPNGFLLTREKIDFVPEKMENVEILTQHVTDNEKLLLLQKTKQSDQCVFIEINSSSFDWLPQLQTALKNNPNIVIYSQNTEPDGILGLINCIRREPKKAIVRCVLMMDSEPKLDIQDSFYQMQLKKQMAINIFKDGKWGTYRHLLLDNVKEVETAHLYVKNMTKGDLSSLKWIEGNLNTETKLGNQSTLAFPYYSSLNFKDIMIASGRVSVDAFTRDRIEQEFCQGFEFCGLDTRGRRIMGMINKGALSTVVAAASDFLWEIPDEWSFEDASTVVVVYATVIYGLMKVIQIKSGMSILIHSATGGIGLAAINLCLHHGCDIFVTVGTQEKRDYLKKHFPQIPESHIGNSRDQSFEGMINLKTKGLGVDVVLNSLSEEKLRTSVRCVTRGGNFLEIGKFDLENDTALNLLLLENNINYHGVMLDRIFAQPPVKKAWIVEKIYEGMKLGYVKPLPRTVFKRDQIVQAYKYMANGKHIGKVVIQVRDEEDNIEPGKQVFKGVPRFICDSEKTYIIVGGLGGFGLELADWLYLREAKKVILVSRLGIQTGYQQQRIKIWRSCGVTVQISTADVTTKEGCLDLISETTKLGPVDGIFNLAVVLKDALFEDQNEETFVVSLAPKAQATMHLDQITRRHCPQLRYFVVFSSVTCGRGNPGQTNYGMANSVMERICEKRKTEGLPGLAIQWGAVGDVGLVAKMQKDNKELVIGGTLQQKISSCLEVLDELLKQDSPIVSSMVVAEKNFERSDLRTAVDVIAYVLGIKNIKTVSHHTTFAELGMDSIMGTEVIQILEKELDIYITAKEVRNLTFAKLTELEAQRKDSNTVESKTKSGIDLLLQYIHREEKSHHLPTRKLPSHMDAAENVKTIHLLPGIEGEFTGMEDFTKNLKANVLGIHYVNHSCTSSIEEYAQIILPHIEETVSKEGTFFIVGYSFGSVIAVELVSLLEEKGFTGHLVVIDGAPGYVSAALKRDYPINSDKDLQTCLLLKVLAFLQPVDRLTEQKEKFLQCKDFDELFQLTTSQLPPEMLQNANLTKQAFLSLFNRFKSVISYRFNHEKIRSQVHLFKAKFPMVDDFADDYQLSEMCELRVNVDEVDGDHVKILKEKKLMESVNKLLVL